MDIFQQRPFANISFRLAIFSTPQIEPNTMSTQCD